MASTTTTAPFPFKVTTEVVPAGGGGGAGVVSDCAAYLECLKRAKRAPRGTTAEAASWASRALSDCRPLLGSACAQDPDFYSRLSAIDPALMQVPW